MRFFRLHGRERVRYFTILLAAVLFGTGMQNLLALDLGNIKLVDDQASTNTIAFYANLMKLTDAPSFAFGHQGASDLGVGWSGTAPYTRSDTYDVIAGLNGGTGDYDAVDGYNINWVLLGTILPGSGNPKPGYPGEPLRNVTLKKTNAQRISGEFQAAYARGEMIAIHAPLDNPDAETTIDSYTNPHPERGSLVLRCLPAGYGGNTNDGDLYPAFIGNLDSFAQLIKGDSGLGLANIEYIPILFRPWHEWNFDHVSWFSAGQCSSNELIAIWQFTVHYMRDVKGVHNLIYVWAPSLNVAAEAGLDAAASEANYFSRWPGDDYVDVVGGDCYYSASNGNYASLIKMLPIIVTNGAVKNKVVALAEAGPKSGMPAAGFSRFWNDNFLRPVLRDLGTNATRVAYVMTWASGGTATNPAYFSTWPEPGNTDQETDFYAFWKDPATRFASGIAGLYAGQAYTFSPTDDAFVYSGSPAANYGSTTLLKVSSNAYQSFLKFNVTGIPSNKTVAAVRLKLWSQTVDQNVTVRAVTDTNWTESTVTWSNQPAMGASLKTVRVYTNSLAVFSLPGAVAGNSLVSFGLQGSAAVMNQFYSKETGTGSQRPQLELVVVDAPGTNHWPQFSTNALVMGSALLGWPYSTSLAGAASDADGDKLTFDMLFGPVWLTVSTNGVLGGTPPVEGGTTNAIATVRVRDLAGAFAVAQLTIPVVTNTQSTLTTLPVAEDTFGYEYYPDTNYGLNSVLRLRSLADKTWSRVSFLKFNIASLSTPVSSAKLKLYSTTQNGMVYAYTVADNSWQELNLTWNTMPAIGALIGSGMAASNSWFEIDVTGYITGPGTYSIALEEMANVLGELSSREGGNPPVLAIESSAVPTVYLPGFSGGNLILTGAGFPPDTTYSVLTTTNLLLPLSSWTTHTTGVLNSSGTFSNAIPAGGDLKRFFRVKAP